MTTIRSLITEWGFAVDDAALDRADKKLAAVMQRANTVGRSATNAFGGGRASVFGNLEQSLGTIGSAASGARRLVLGLGAALAAKSLAVGGYFKLIGGFEQTDIAFETLIGDAEKAHKTLAELKAFAKATPFQFGDVADLSKRLLAFGFAADELIPTMTALGNIAAGVGKEKLPQLVLALGQVRTATKLRGQELRQFTEAGVPLIGELAKTLGKPEKAIAGMVEAGQIGYKDVEKALVNVTSAGGRFNNLMARQSSSLLGIVSNIIDTVQLLAVDLGNRGLLKRAKQFTANVLGILESHREQILEGMQAAIDLLIGSIENVVRLARAAWQVFRGLTQAVGGTRRALELMLKALAFIAGARMLFLIGQFGLGLLGVVRAFTVMGNAALLAEAKIALIPLAIGAAIAALGLIIEDIVAYFQGRKSITGLILKDMDHLSEGVAKIIDPILDKVKAFGSTLGKSIIDGLASLTDADWAKVADGVMKAFELLLTVSQIPMQLGLAIANGILEGLIQGLKERFPEVADFLGLNGKPNGIGTPGPVPPFGANGQTSWGDTAIAGLHSLGQAFNQMVGGSNGPAAASGAFPGAKWGGQTNNISVTSPINVNVNGKADPGDVAASVRQGVRDGVYDATRRETHRALKPAHN